VSTTPTPASGTRRSVSEMFERAKLSEHYWLEAIELCETRKHRRSLAQEIAKLAKAARSNKRLAEIAAMDALPTLIAEWEADVAYWESEARKLPRPSFSGHEYEGRSKQVGRCLDQLMDALGLSPKNSKKAGRKL
jgi:hypothetical protein